MGTLFHPTVKTPVSLDELTALLEHQRIAMSPMALRLLFAQLCAEHGVQNYTVQNVWCYNLGNKRPMASEPYCLLASAWENAKPKDVPPGSTLLAPSPRWSTPEGMVAYLPPVAQNRFRAYDSMEEGLLGLLQFYEKPRWRAAQQALLVGDSAGFVRELKKQGYFSAAESKYLAALTPHLARFDRWEAQKPDLPPAEPSEEVAGTAWYQTLLERQLTAVGPTERPVEFRTTEDLLKDIWALKTEEAPPPKDDTPRS
jgi:hypothetical protein